MFCGEIESVNNTRIITARVFPSKLIKQEDKYGRIRHFKQPYGSPLQLVVYSNQIRLTRNPVDHQGSPNTAMILPFPIRPDIKNRFKIFPLTNYENIFEDFESLFAEVQMQRQDDISMPIVNVGSYEVTIAKDIATIEQTFIKQDMINLLKQYYPKGFGFLICMLKANAQYHPFAYVHEIRKDDKLFIPTRHHYAIDGDKKYSNNKFGGFHEWSGFQSGDNGEIDVGAAKDSKYASQSRPDVTLVDDHFHDTLLLEDKWMRHQVRRQTTSNQVVIDWDHHIYVVNQPIVLDYIKKLNSRPELPATERFAAVQQFINMSLIPHEITFGGIKYLYRLRFSPKSPGNYDIYL